MSFCERYSLARLVGEQVHAIPLRCRTWPCEYCGPQRRRQLIAQVIAGAPTAVLTLTSNPAIGLSPAHRCWMMKKALPELMRRAAARAGIEKIEYMAFPELTKHGEPHLHIPLRGPYIDQAWLARTWKALTGAYIVWIEKLDGPGRAARYVAKYVTKGPARFGRGKRYWGTRNYAPGWTPEKPVMDAWDPPWVRIEKSLDEYVRHAEGLGWWVAWERDMAILTYGRPP